MRGMRTATLPVWSSVMVVCAHPDDESFGLGAVLSRFAEAGCRLGLLCFTHGEASTLHDAAGELHAVRADELAAASAVLGVDPVTLLDYPDGGLAAHDVDELADHVIGLCSEATAWRAGAGGMLAWMAPWYGEKSSSPSGFFYCTVCHGRQNAADGYYFITKAQITR